jgi:glyoxylase-like metal-dependent hydrolase (beta-lactamase superfamily II)
MTALTRRRSLIGLSAACVAFAGCADAAVGKAGQLFAVAPGVYMMRGASGAADEHNLGRIGNAGFIVGPEGVIVVDTGTSYAHGQALLAAIAAVTDRPVRVALVTHARPEFLFGGMAFRERGIPIRMHSRTVRLMASRCETCLKTLRQQVGDEPMRGTTLYKADQEYEATHELALTGRPVRVLYFGHSSGPGDVAVLDVATGTLFAGGLLDAHRIPDIQDSDLPGWHRALHALRDLRVSTVVPGHGSATSSAMIDTLERYLVQLEARAKALVDAGESLIDVADALDLPEFAAWDQYDTIHRRNASIAFLRFERELMFK